MRTLHKAKSKLKMQQKSGSITKDTSMQANNACTRKYWHKKKYNTCRIKWYDAVKGNLKENSFHCRVHHFSTPHVTYSKKAGNNILHILVSKAFQAVNNKNATSLTSNFRANRLLNFCCQRELGEAIIT